MPDIKNEYQYTCMLEKLPLSYIELSKKNLIDNIRQFRNLVKRGTKISVAIKGNAYGHGQNEVAKIVESYVDYFQVNSAEELELLRKVSDKRTFVLGYVEKNDLEKIIKLNGIVAIFSLKELRDIDKIAEKLNLRPEIQIPIDAHLGREGFLEDDWSNLFTEIKKCRNVKLSGIYAHFANIENTLNFSHAQKQIKKYSKALKLARDFGFDNFETHISATSGVLVYEKNKGIHDVIRIGIGLYGMWPSLDIKKMCSKKIELKPVLSWKTKVAQVKTLPKGSTVGYGLTYKTKKTTKIAIIPQGYADGFDRGLSNKGGVLIKGTRCKIVGIVSMNMFAVDVNHLPTVKAEDEVVILGRQGNKEIRAEEIARLIDTFNYEITARISSLLPRVIV